MLRIKFELIKRGITQAEFAEAVGLKPQAVSRIANGLEPPYSKRAERIARALDWQGDPADLFREVEIVAVPKEMES